MSKLTVTIILMLFALEISGCSNWIYRPNIQQGNVVTQAMLNQLQIGMTEEQVRSILGAPLLVDTFNINRWDYVYTFRHGVKRAHQQVATIKFQNGRVIDYTRTLPSTIPPHQ